MAVDILLAISDVPNDWIAGENQTDTSDLSEDTFTSDLGDAKFFEVDDFSLGLGVDDRDESEQKSDEDKRIVNTLRELIDRKELVADPQSKDSGKQAEGLAAKLQRQGRRKFDKWLSGQDNPVKTASNGSTTGGYPLEFQEFEFKRQMDQASIFLFDACCNSKTLHQAVLLKRSASGGASAQAYLRVDFDEILITSLDWKVDDTVTETVKFICRGATVHYRQQLNTGKMDAQDQSAKWVPVNQLSTEGAA